MILSKKMIEIKNEIELTGFFRLTALNNFDIKNAIRKMEKINMIKRLKSTESYIDFIQNWI